MNITMAEKNNFMKSIEEVGYNSIKQDFLSEKYDVMCKLLKKEINNADAATLLQITISHIKKIKRKIKDEGYRALIHKMKGKTKEGKFSLETKALIVSLFNGTYAFEKGSKKYDFANTTYSYLHKHLTKKDGDLEEFKIKISYSQIRNILRENGLLSIKSKKYNKSHNSAGRMRAVEYLPGQRLEMDGTFLDFLGNGKILCAHVIYDRGLKAPISIYIGEGETTYGYMMALQEVMVKYGTPQKVISDRRSTFYKSNPKKTESKYSTKFNEMLDKFNVKYKYTSNPNGKPGVEKFNDEFKTNIVFDIKRHEIKTKEELNKYLKTYVNFIQKEKLQGLDDVYGKKFKVEEYENIAILKSKEYTIQSKGRIRMNKNEYELLKNEELRQFPKGTKVDYIQSLAGNYFEYKNVKYEHKISIEVEEEKYEKIKVVEKECKIKDDGSILFDKIKYVIVQNNLRHLELESGVCVNLQKKKNKIICHYQGSCYAVIKVEEYKYKEEIVPKKECSVKFHCLVTYCGEEYVLIDKNAKTAYQPDGVNRLLIKYSVDGIYAFNGLEQIAKILKKSKCTSFIPRSNIEAKRLRAKVVL